MKNNHRFKSIESEIPYILCIPFVLRLAFVPLSKHCAPPVNRGNHGISSTHTHLQPLELAEPR